MASSSGAGGPAVTSIYQQHLIPPTSYPLDLTKLQECKDVVTDIETSPDDYTDIHKAEVYEAHGIAVFYTGLYREAIEQLLKASAIRKESKLPVDRSACRVASLVRITAEGDLSHMSTGNDPCDCRISYDFNY